MNGTSSTQDGNQRKHVREHVLANAAIQLMNGESPDLTPSAQAHLEHCDLCAARLGELRDIMSTEREDAVAAADAAFPESRLREQRVSILARLEQARAGSRVLHFPRSRPPARGWRSPTVPRCAGSPARPRPACWSAWARVRPRLPGIRSVSTRPPPPRPRPTGRLARWRSAGPADAPQIERLPPASEEAFLSDMELVLNKRKNAAMRAMDEQLAPNDKDRRDRRSRRKK